jgi:hypothetical protein
VTVTTGWLGMCEIAENLHRADLTALERDKHVAEWIRLADASQFETHEPKKAEQPSKTYDAVH